MWVSYSLETSVGTEVYINMYTYFQCCRFEKLSYFGTKIRFFYLQPCCKLQIQKISPGFEMSGCLWNCQYLGATFSKRRVLGGSRTKEKHHPAQRSRAAWAVSVLERPLIQVMPELRVFTNEPNTWEAIPVSRRSFRLWDLITSS